MKAKHIYINTQGVPCIPAFRIVDSSDLEEAKKSAIPIREEDRDFFNDYFIAFSIIDTFYSVEPYEFEVMCGMNDQVTEPMACPVCNGSCDSKQARIIRPSEPNEALDTCTSCNGSGVGSTPDEKCHQCKGSGEAWRSMDKKEIQEFNKASEPKPTKYVTHDGRAIARGSKYKVDGETELRDGIPADEWYRANIMEAKSGPSKELILQEQFERAAKEHCIAIGRQPGSDMGDFIAGCIKGMEIQKEIDSPKFKTLEDWGWEPIERMEQEFKVKVRTDFGNVIYYGVYYSKISSVWVWYTNGNWSGTICNDLKHGMHEAQKDYEEKCKSLLKPNTHATNPEK